MQSWTQSNQKHFHPCWVYFSLQAEITSCWKLFYSVLVILEMPTQIRFCGYSNLSIASTEVNNQTYKNSRYKYIHLRWRNHKKLPLEWEKEQAVISFIGRMWAKTDLCDVGGCVLHLEVRGRGQALWKAAPRGLMWSLAQGHFSRVGVPAVTGAVLQQDGCADEVATNLSCPVIKQQHNNWRLIKYSQNTHRNHNNNDLVLNNNNHNKQ